MVDLFFLAGFTFILSFEFPARTAGETAEAEREALTFFDENDVLLRGAVLTVCETVEPRLFTELSGLKDILFGH
jgi:hypothetical protein